MKKAAIITVGTNEGIENGIYASLKQSNPNFVIYLASKKSQATLDRSPKGAPDKTLRDLCENEIIEIPVIDDINDIFEKCEDAYHQLLNRGYQPSELVVDNTTGTKAMVSALAALAILRGLDIIYVSGPRQQSIVKTGAERPITTSPRRIIRRFQLEKLKDYFSQYQFSACRELAQQELKRIEPFSTAEEDNELKKAHELVNFLEGFIHWEHFDHKGASSHFADVKSIKVQSEYLNELRADYEKTARIHEDDKGNKRYIPSKYLIVDLFCNAKRRAHEGNFDDAVARLYRCIEMTSQYSLAETHNIYSDNVPIETIQGKISPENFQRLSANNRNGETQVALMEGLALFRELSPQHPLSVIYDNLQGQLKNSLKFRNNSILAHGVVPVNKENYDEMEKVAKQFVEAVVGPLDPIVARIDECFDVKNLEALIP